MGSGIELMRCFSLRSLPLSPAGDALADFARSLYTLLILWPNGVIYIIINLLENYLR